MPTHKRRRDRETTTGGQMQKPANSIVRRITHSRECRWPERRKRLRTPIPGARCDTGGTTAGRAPDAGEHERDDGERASTRTCTDATGLQIDDVGRVRTSEASGRLGCRPGDDGRIARKRAADASPTAHREISRDVPMIRVRPPPVVRQLTCGSIWLLEAPRTRRRRRRHCPRRRDRRGRK